MQIRSSVAIVTGASAGIGRATALALASRGATVVLAARRRDRLDELERAIAGKGGRALAAPCDVTEPTEIRRLANLVREAFGRCDILVNNAGIPAQAGLLELSDERLEAVVATNLLSVLHATRAFLPGMLERGRGHIVNVASIAGRHAVPASGVYSATKHAVVAFSESTNHETRPRGVLMTAVNPGFVATEGFPQDDVPSVLVMTPERVARAIVKVIDKGRAPEVTVPRVAGSLEILRMIAPGPYRWAAGRALMRRQRNR